MFGVAYGSHNEKLNRLILDIETLSNNMLFCAFQNERLIVISDSFATIVSSILRKDETIIINRVGNDVHINGHTVIKITIPIGKEIFLMWYKGSKYMENIWEQLSFDSVLLKGIFD